MFPRGHEPLIQCCSDLPFKCTSDLDPLCLHGHEPLDKLGLSLQSVEDMLELGEARVWVGGVMWWVRKRQVADIWREKKTREID